MVPMRCFATVSTIPEWLGVIQSVGILGRDDENRVTRASFVALLQRGMLGYSLVFEYDTLSVRWKSAEGQLFQQHGSARFQPLGDRACLLHYDLTIGAELGELLQWQDPLFDGHPASAVVHDFRHYVKRKVSMAELTLRSAS